MKTKKGNKLGVTVGVIVVVLVAGLAIWGGTAGWFSGNLFKVTNSEVQIQAPSTAVNLPGTISNTTQVQTPEETETEIPAVLKSFSYVSQPYVGNRWGATDGKLSMVGRHLSSSAGIADFPSTIFKMEVTGTTGWVDLYGLKLKFTDANNEYGNNSKYYGGNNKIKLYAINDNGIITQIALDNNSDGRFTLNEFTDPSGFRVQAGQTKTFAIVNSPGSNISNKETKATIEYFTTKQKDWPMAVTSVSVTGGSFDRTIYWD